MSPVDNEAADAPQPSLRRVAWKVLRLSLGCVLVLVVGEAVLVGIEWLRARGLSACYPVDDAPTRILGPEDTTSIDGLTSLELAHRHVPTLFRSPEEPHQLLDIRYLTVERDDRLCIEYWNHWDHSSISKGVLAAFGFRAEHAMDLEPLFVYLDERGEMTHLAYTAGHGTRGTRRYEEMVVRDASHPVFSVIEGTHHFRPYEESRPEVETLPVQLIPLDESMIRAWNAVIGGLPQPGTMDAIVRDPWTFFDRPGASFNVFLGDHSGRVFYQPAVEDRSVE